MLRCKLNAAEQMPEEAEADDGEQCESDGTDLIDQSRVDEQGRQRCFEALRPRSRRFGGREANRFDKRKREYKRNKCKQSYSGQYERRRGITSLMIEMES